MIAPLPDPTDDRVLVTGADGFIGFHVVEPQPVGRIMNLGSSHEVSIGETVDLIADIMGADIEAGCDAIRVRPAETVDWFSQSENMSRFKADRYMI